MADAFDVASVPRQPVDTENPLSSDVESAPAPVDAGLAQTDAALKKSDGDDADRGDQIKLVVAKLSSAPTNWYPCLPPHCRAPGPGP